MLGLGLGTRKLTTKLLQVLKYHPDYTNEQIADDIGISIVGVRSRIKRLNRLFGTQTRAGAQFDALVSGKIKREEIRKSSTLN